MGRSRLSSIGGLVQGPGGYVSVNAMPKYDRSPPVRSTGLRQAAQHTGSACQEDSRVCSRSQSVFSNMSTIASLAKEKFHSVRWVERSEAEIWASGGLSNPARPVNYSVGLRRKPNFLTKTRVLAKSAVLVRGCALGSIFEAQPMSGDSHGSSSDKLVQHAAVPRGGTAEGGQLRPEC